MNEGRRRTDAAQASRLVQMDPENCVAHRFETGSLIYPLPHPSSGGFAGAV
jgi:hypothetical protein